MRDSMCQLCLWHLAVFQCFRAFHRRTLSLKRSRYDFNCVYKTYDMVMGDVADSTDVLDNLNNITVQNILDDSVNVEIRQRFDSAYSLLSPFSGNISELTENLILTSASNVNSQNLEALNISCLISCAPELPDSPLQECVIYHKVDVVDTGCSRMLPHFDPVADLIHQVSNLGGKTMVFCVAGVSRSASICIAYLMKHHKLTLLDAYNFVKLRRSRIRPNCGFFMQLIEYEKTLFGCNTVHMIYNKVVQMEIPDVYDSDYRVVTTFSKKNSSNSRR